MGIDGERLGRVSEGLGGLSGRHFVRGPGALALTLLSSLLLPLSSLLLGDVQGDPGV